MVECLAAHTGGGHEHAQVFHHLFLPGERFEPAGAQRALEVLVGADGLGADVVVFAVGSHIGLIIHFLAFFPDFLWVGSGAGRSRGGKRRVSGLSIIPARIIPSESA